MLTNSVLIDQSVSSLAFFHMAFSCSMTIIPDSFFLLGILLIYIFNAIPKVPQNQQTPQQKKPPTPKLAPA